MAGWGQTLRFVYTVQYVGQKVLLRKPLVAMSSLKLLFRHIGHTRGIAPASGGLNSAQCCCTFRLSLGSCCILDSAKVG